jgi:hypothetical protein
MTIRLLPEESTSLAVALTAAGDAASTTNSQGWESSSLTDLHVGAPQRDEYASILRVSASYIATIETFFDFSAIIVAMLPQPINPIDIMVVPFVMRQS